MFHRRSFARRLSLESLEIRCNPSAMDPLAGLFADLAPGDQSLANVPAYSLVIDPRASLAEDATTTQYTPSEDSQARAGTDTNSSNSNAYFTNDYSLTIGNSAASTPPASETARADLSAFAGQTVTILIEAADASTASGEAGGGDQDGLLGGAGQDQIAQTLLTHEAGHTLGLRHEHDVPTSTSDGSVRFISDSVTTIVWAAEVPNEGSRQDPASTGGSGVGTSHGSVFYHLLPSSADADPVRELSDVLLVGTAQDSVKQTTDTSAG